MATLSATRPVFSKTEQTSKSLRNQKRHSQSRSAPICGNDYLNHSFLPVQSEVYPGLHDTDLVQRAFFKSLKNFSKLYNFDCKTHQDLPYPENMISALEKATKQLGTKSMLELVLMQNEQHVATITTIKQFDLDYTLYYIPVEPLFCLLQNKKRKDTANLVLSIFCYLLKVQHVPYFTDENHYLYHVYDRMETNMHEDREYEIENDSQDDETAKQQTEWYQIRCDLFSSAFKNGASVLKLIQQNVHLNDFKFRIECYNPKDEAETMLKKTAEIAYGLFREFPNRSFQDNINLDLTESEDDDTRHLKVEEYLSFFWSAKDDLNDELWDWVNSELQESCIADVPSSCQYFDTPQKTEFHDFQFETKFIDLLDELADTLRILTP